LKLAANGKRAPWMLRSLLEDGSAVTALPKAAKARRK